MDHTSLEAVHHTKYLGATISDGTPIYVADIKGRANKLLGLLR